MYKKSYTAALLTSAIVLTTALPSTAFALENNKPAKEVIFQSPRLKQINISPNSYFEVKDVYVIPGENENIVTYTMKIHNGDNKEIQLIDYWMRLTTKQGGSYSSKVFTKDKDKSIVASKTDLEITYYAKVGVNTKIEDLKFKFIKWDFSAANYEKLLGEITIPKGFNYVTPLGSQRIYNISGTSIKTNIGDVLINSIEDYDVIKLNYNMENTGKTTAKDLKLKYSLRTQSGTLYPLTSELAADFKLQPKEKKVNTLVGVIPKNVDLVNAQLVVVREEETEKIDLPVATYKLPKVQVENSITPVNEKKEITTDDTKLSVSITKAQVNSNTSNRYVTISLNIENVGKKPFTVPAYSFVLRTGSGGLNYPMTYKLPSGTVINPLTNKNLQLTVTVPASVNVENLQLLMNKPAAQDDKNQLIPSFPLAIFNVPKNQTPVPGNSNEVVFEDKKGVYGVKLDSVQRIPVGDKDVVAVKLTLSNKSKENLPIPSLEGVFTFDDISLTNEVSKLISLDNVLLMKPDSQMSLYLITKVPYTLEYKKLDLVLQEKDGEETIELAKLSSSSIAEYPIVKAGEGYIIDNVGNKSQIVIKNTKIYESLKTKLVYSEVELENLEVRYSDLQKLIGLYKANDGQIYQATISKIESRVSPGGKVLLSVWAKLPNQYNPSDLQLVLAEGVQTSAPTTGGTTNQTEPDGAVNAIAFELPAGSDAVQSTFTGLDLNPYVLNLSNIRTSLMRDVGINMSFDYNLLSNDVYESKISGHQLVMEIFDNSSGQTFETSFTLGEGSGEVLPVGSSSKTVTINDPNIFKKITSINSYELRIYDRYENHKRLLAKQNYRYEFMAGN